MNLETERLWCFQDAFASVLTTLCAVTLADAVSEYYETADSSEANFTLYGFVTEPRNRLLFFGYITSFIEIVRFWLITSLVVKYLENAPEWFFIGWNVSYFFAFFLPLTSSSLDRAFTGFYWNLFFLQLSVYACAKWAFKKLEVAGMEEDLYPPFRFRLFLVGLLNTFLLVWGYTDHPAIAQEWYEIFLLFYCVAVLFYDWKRWWQANRESIKLKTKKYVGFPRARLEFYFDGVIVISGTLLMLGFWKESEYWPIALLLWWRLTWLWIDNHRALWFSGGKSSEQEIKTVTGYTLIANIVHIFFVALLPFCFKTYMLLEDEASVYVLVVLFLILEFTKLWVYWASAFGNRLSCCGMCKACFCLFLSRKICGSKREYPRFVQQVGLWNYRLSASQQLVSISRPRVKYAAANKDLVQPFITEKESTNVEFNQNTICKKSKLETSYSSKTILEDVKLANPLESESGILEFTQQREQNTIEPGTSYASDGALTTVHSKNEKFAEEEADLLLYFELAQQKIWISILVLVSVLISSSFCGDECLFFVGIWPLLIVDVYAMLTYKYKFPLKRTRLSPRYGSNISSNYVCIQKQVIQE